MTDALDVKVSKDLGGTSAEEEDVVERCNYCDKELIIPSKVHKEIRSASRERGMRAECLDKEYDAFYVSSYGFFYCNHDCCRIFTED